MKIKLRQILESNFENKFKWEHIKQEKYNKIDKSNLTSHNKLSLRKYLDELFDSDENYEDLSKTFDLRFDKLSTKNKISEDKQKDNNQDNSEISNVNYNAPWKYH